MPAEVGISCRCGAVTGRLTGIDPTEGTHLVCHCADCQRADAHFGITRSRADGVDIWQTTPDRVVIERGADHLRILRLSPNGLFRWYAGCCDTPMFNTMSGPGMPFVGVLTNRLTDVGPLGPVIARGYVEAPGGKSRHQNGGTVIWRFMKRAASARLSGRWRRTPFFDVVSGKPVAEPQLAPRSD